MYHGEKFNALSHLGAAALGADVTSRVVAALRSAPRDDGSTRIVVVSTPARRRLRECIAVELPEVRVLSWSELSDDVRLEAEARIR